MKWKNLPYWVKGVIIGFIIGILRNPLLLLFGETPLIYTLVFDDIICKLFDIPVGEQCNFFSFFYGFIYAPIIFAIIGVGVGYLYNLFKR